MKTIIFSLLCHENLDCIIDLILNIKIYSSQFKSYILISSKELIYNIRDKYDFDENIIIVNVRGNINIWGNIEIFQKHIIHMKYLYDNNINFDYFWFLSSNEYFIKNITPEFLEDNVIKIYGEKNNTDNYDEYFSNFVNEKNDWVWYNEIRKDNYTMNKFKENKLYFYNIPHESLVLPSILVNEIMNFYLSLNIYENSNFTGYCMEEIFVISYIFSKYITTDLNTFCHRFYYEKDLMIKYNNHECDNLYNIFSNENLTLTVKPVYRNYDDILRVFLRNKSNYNLRDFVIEDLNINKYYYSKTLGSSILIDNDNTINFRKYIKNKLDYCWIGYKLKGNMKYKLSFDINPNKDINNFNFIKIHNPVIYYKIDNHIHVNEWNHIELIININSDYDFLCFIFDDYNDSLIYQLKNVTFNILESNILNKYNNEFVLNKYNFEKNNVYYSINNNSSIIIDDNIIEFNKLNNNYCDYCWIGYDLSGPNNYNISFDIYTNKNINNFHFVKIHNPVKHYDIPYHIPLNQWTYVSININIESVYDLLIFIFDNYNDNLNIKFRNITIDKI